MGKEIERRFKLDGIPEGVDTVRFKLINQQFIVTGFEEVRVRKTVSGAIIKYNLTIKRGKGLERKETEVPITEQTYNRLVELSQHEPLEKVRYEVELENGKIAEIDRFFHDTSLVVVEVEFKTVEEAEQFKPPIWFGEEITRKSQYNSVDLWKSINGQGESENDIIQS